MTGTILNIITVLIGGAAGLLFGARFPDKMRETIIAGLGLFTAAIGIIMFSDSTNAIIVLASLLLGGITGELLDIELALSKFGAWLEARFAGGSGEVIEGNRFIRGFLTASLVFCIGPMTIIGSIQDGLSGDYQLLAIKSVLDGFAALAFASTLGPGVLFSVITILVFQGGLSLSAASMQALMNDAMITEMTAAGGVLLLGLAISSLLEIKKIRVGNFLPALVFAPLLVALLPGIQTARATLWKLIQPQ
jgi:hypothetical protein